MIFIKVIIYALRFALGETVVASVAAFSYAIEAHGSLLTEELLRTG